MGQYRSAEIEMKHSNRTHLFRQLEQLMKHVLKIAGAVSIACGLFAGISTVAAHHSGSMFDYTKSITLNGTVVELRWVNPHVSLSVNGTTHEGEEPALWVLEMTSPGNLMRVSGWSRSSVKPGDRVEVVLSPLRDPDKKGGSLKKLTLLDTGQVYSNDIRSQEKPGLE
jgi:hypothetical protein